MPKGAINITDRTWLISEEITNLDDKENIFEMSYESRALDTDTLDAPPGHVITGKKNLKNFSIACCRKKANILQDF